MMIGYARTSTLEQVAGLQAQERDLKVAGAEKIFCEQVSSVGKRPVLDEAMTFMRSGDVFVATKIDRLARSVSNLWHIVQHLEKSGVRLKILELNLDTGTPTGKLMLSVMGGVAEFERAMMLERQREGVAKAKADGRYKGRKPTARAKRAEVIALSEAGLSMGKIANVVNISKTSVHRILKSRSCSSKDEFHAAVL